MSRNKKKRNKKYQPKFSQKQGREMDGDDLQKEQEEMSEVVTYESYAIDDITEETVFTTDEKGNKIVDKENGMLDSWEEWWFVCYLNELKAAGVIIDADKNTEPLDLSTPIRHTFTKVMKTKTKSMVRHLANPITYEHDFNIKWHYEWKDKFFTVINSGKEYGKIKAPFMTFSVKFDASMIEVKADYTKPAELQITNMKIAWMYDKRQMYIQMLRIPKLFKETFTPKAYMEHMVYKRPNKNKGIKTGDSRLKYKPVTCEEYLEKLKEDTARQQTLQ